MQKKRDEDQKKDRTATSSEKPLPKWDEIETWFKEVLAHTTNEPASELSGRYFKIKDDGEETDLTAITKGFITLTPLQYNMTKHAVLAEMERSWKLSVPQGSPLTP